VAKGGRTIDFILLGLKMAARDKSPLTTVVKRELGDKMPLKGLLFNFSQVYNLKMLESGIHQN
jgi:hypothetical protein